MTLIMGLTLGRGIALVGDVLVTGDGASAKASKTPSVEDANKALGKVTAHVGTLCQKVNVLRDDVILSWAGSYDQARAVMREVADMLTEPSAVSILPQLIHSQISDYAKDLSVIGFIRGRNTTQFFWDGQTRHFSSTLFSQAIAAGSGSGQMLSLVNRYESKFVSSLNDNDNDQIKAVIHALGLSAQVFGIEHLTQDNLIGKWGGGFEIALFNKGVATKIGNILYAFWFCEKSGTDLWQLSLLPTFIRTSYHNDLLVTETLSASSAPRFIVIPPLLSSYMPGDDVEISPSVGRYDWLCNCIFIREGNQIVDTFSYVHHHSQGLPINIVKSSSILGDQFPLELKYRQKTEVKVSHGYYDFIAQLASGWLGSDRVLPIRH